MTSSIQSTGTHGAGRNVPLLPAIGLTVVALVVLGAIFAPLLVSNQPADLVDSAYAPPGSTLLGTDVLGRDLFSRLLFGARLTLLVAFGSTTIGFALGCLWGLAAAELGGWFDDLTDWIVNIVLAFPPLMLGLLLVSALAPSLAILIGALAAIQLPRVVRVARAIGQNVSSLQFVEVARARGEGLFSVLYREILPNILRPLAAEYGLRVTYATLFISGLSFLGLGIQPPDADWGGLVRENMSAMQIGSMLPVLAPACAIGVFAVAMNLVIDWIDESTFERQMSND
ncbi:ABC transporter permease [Mesorhizobium retamae]|uniref:ABC transporter permease n=1 Tax=Mesorhizobium retamae TaxID=2912854 RepID=A0ABS9QD96_9HYPH|nr:ABC transporter permease [Mesorhizobium sp. IRAMC:0171]MCG7505388.1 ABC transporter permease [Mesorhizobium sp. IRAMC:0171]